jgi:hypothetical protein
MPDPPDTFEERVRCVCQTAREAHEIGDDKVCAECARRIAEMISE